MALDNERFPAIEGLRAWLAMAVVASHLSHVSGYYAWNRVALATMNAGSIAVLVFVIVSGFVITHLVLGKRESYGVYVSRRFFRIFLVYAVCTVVCGVLLHVAIPEFRWSPVVLRELVESQETYFWQHVIAHIAMLHGAISNNVLPLSQYAFLPPAWSISLEWQFYVIAPFVILMRTRALMMTIVLLGAFLYQVGVFGSFRNPSLLFGAGVYFAVGIATRLAMPFTTRIPLALTLGLACGLLYSWACLPFVIWGAVVTAMRAPEATGIERLYQRGCNALLTNRIALWLGARSYSVYLGHLIVILLIDRAIWMWNPGIGQFRYTALLTVGTLPCVLVLSWFLYRFVEVPGIAAGRYFAVRRSLREVKAVG